MDPIPFAELKSQWRVIEQEVRTAIDAVLNKCWYILGTNVNAFEEEFAHYLGAKHAVGVASGTDALQLALMALGIEPGDEVITVANTCVPTLTGIANAGARPVLVDIDPATFTLAPAALEGAITKRTRAIVPVHLYGHPCDMDPIMSVAARHGIAVVEDCAQAHGAQYRGQHCGTFGQAAAFSFYPSKNLGAYGDGGAVVTDDPSVDTRLRMLRNYGEERRYYHTIRGMNSRLDEEIQAAILRVKLRHLDAWNLARRERAALYRRLLVSANDVTLPVEATWARHIYHLFVVRTAYRARLQEHLERQGIGTYIHYPVAIHLQGAFAYLGLERGAFPQAERACDEVLSLPMYAELPLEHIERIAEATAGFRP